MFALGLTLLIVAIGALLAVPVDVSFATPQRDEAGGVRVEWLFGVVSRSLPLPDSARPADDSSLFQQLRELARVRNEEVQARTLLLLRRLRRAVEVRTLHARVRVGLGNPADTGMLWGLIAPLLAVAQTWPNVDLRVEPDFLTGGLRGEARAALRVIPLRALPPLVGFGCSPAVVRAAWTLFSTRRN